MQQNKVAQANAAYRTGDYGNALKLYYELASEIGHEFFYANISLSLKKMRTKQDEICAATLEIIKNKRYDILNEIFGKDIVVSLTSYPGRISTVHETIESILNQSFKPKTLVLWLAKEQFPNLERDLPHVLLQLKNKGLSIEWCEDIRSFKKLIPTLKKFPNKTIVTADDDIIYHRDWLAQLAITHIQVPYAIICHRAHRVLLDKDKGYSPYRTWLKEVREEDLSYNYLFTGCGGVLYPPGSLHHSVTDSSAFSTICPNGDDLWFWSMALLNGTKIRIVKDSCFKLDFIPGTQDTALWIQNVQAGGNDVMLRALHARYPAVLEKLKGNKKVSVSIIMPVYNTGGYLIESLDSIINQDFRDFEVLCIDDGSTDPITKDILHTFSRKDPRIRVLHQPNSGPATARNNGVANANGTYISFVDSDDYISQNYVGNLYSCALQNNSDIVVADKMLCIDGKNNTLEKRSGFESFGAIDAKQLVAKAIIETGVSCNKIYRRDFLLSNDIRYLDGMRCQSEDNFFSILAMILGHKSVSVGANATYYYRQHGGGITKNITLESVEKSIQVYNEIKDKVLELEISDKKYWINTINQRAQRDLRHLAGALSGSSHIEKLLSEKFSTQIDICCIADENYIVPTLVFLGSVKRAKRKTTIPSITILVPNGSREKMEVLEEMSGGDFFVKVQEVDSSQFANLHKYKDQDNFCMASPSAMFKFIIPNVFKNLDRILYIDTDLIVRKDLLELFMTSMNEEYLCGVPDLWNPVSDRPEIKNYKPYFNSGVMLMNLAKMRDESLPTRLIQAKLKSTNFNLMDQDVFNEVCNGHVKTLDIKYNFLPVCYKRHSHRFVLNDINNIYGSIYNSISDIAADPVVAHWAGSDKPWKSTSTLFADEWVNIHDELLRNGFIEKSTS